ncbi:MAG: hypothetical protein Q9227_002589 [Pyrenula ochraceoflavens]
MDGADDGDSEPDNEEASQGPIKLAPSQIPYLKNLAADFKKDTYAKIFHDQVLSDENELLEKLKNGIRARQEENQRFQGNIQRLLGDALDHSGVYSPQKLPLKFQNQPKSLPLFNRSSHLLDASFRLLDKYNESASWDVGTTSIAKSQEGFTKEAQFARKAIEAGRASITSQIRNSILESPVAVSKILPTEDATLETAVGLMLMEGKTEEGDETETWGTVMTKAKKGYKRFQRATN